MTHPYRAAVMAEPPAARRARLLPLPCTGCGELVHPGEPWDLDHVVPLALGGTADTARPAHQDCNRQAGVETREEIKAAGVAALVDDARFSLTPCFPRVFARASLPNGHNRSTRSRRRARATRVGGCLDRPESLDVPEMRVAALMTRPHPSAVDSFGAEFADGRARWKRPQIPVDVVASVELATTSTTRTSSPLLRELVAGGRLAHDGGAELAAQVEAAGWSRRRRVGSPCRPGRAVATYAGGAWAVAAQVTAADALPFFVY